MVFIDISVGIHERMVKWPSHQDIQVRKVKDLCCGDSTNSSAISFNVHTGTHVDAPSHFLKNSQTLDEMSLDVLVGPAIVVDLGNIDLISRKDLENSPIPSGTKRLLLKTKNSKKWHDEEAIFDPAFVALTRDAAEWIVEKDIQLVGIDALSIQRYRDPDSQVHDILLSESVVIIEGLDLTAAKPGNYELICLPLRIVGCDGAPARAVLR
jgi:arylformamidase